MSNEYHNKSLVNIPAKIFKQKDGKSKGEKDDTENINDTNQEIDIFTLPARSKIHRSKWKDCFSLFNIILLLFIIIIILLFSSHFWNIKNLPYLIDYQQEPSNPAVEIIKKMEGD